MTRDEHLLACLAEECDEVGQRVMKALRFGLSEIQPGQPLNNAERIVDELRDLISVAWLLHREERLLTVSPFPSDEMIKAKGAKIAKFMEISRQEGALSASPLSAQEARDGR